MSEQMSDGIEMASGPVPGVARTSSDAPVAVVSHGLSEALVVFGLISSALTALFGSDWGLAEHVQALGQLGVVLLPIGLAISRSIKHRGAMLANAEVAFAQIRQADPQILEQVLALLQRHHAATPAAAPTPPAAL